MRATRKLTLLLRSRPCLRAVPIVSASGGQRSINGIGIVLTVVRLAERARARKLGLYDAWALLALLVVIMFMAAVNLHITPSTALLSKTTRVAIYYCLAQGFYGVIWCCRLSILASLQRIGPPARLGTMLKYAMGLFIFIWVFLTVQAFWVCKAEPNWKNTPAPQCELGQGVAIAQIITDVFADSLLVFVPVRMFWTSTLSMTHRIRLTAVLSAIVVTTITSMAHVYYFLRFGGLFEAFAAVIETGMSLMVCNLAVVAALALRLAGRAEREDSHRTPSHTSGFSMSRVVGTLPQPMHTLDVEPAKHVHDEEESAFGYKAPELTGADARMPAVRVTREVHHH